MPISTANGRAIKEIVNDNDFAKTKGAKKKFCCVVDKKLNRLANEITSFINKQQWQKVYASTTEIRRYIEIKGEACGNITKADCKIR